MRCEDVRAALPELAESGLRLAGPVEAHIEACPACSEELRRYRTLVLALAALRDEVIEPREGFLGRVLSELPEAARAGFLRRVAGDERVHRAVFSLGGAVVGASAIALLWWRAARRGVASEAPAEAS